MTDEARKIVEWLREDACNSCIFSSFPIGECVSDSDCCSIKAADLIERLSAENDALQMDLQKFASAFPLCEICAKGKFDVECTTWTDENGREVCDFIWRGPC